MVATPARPVAGRLAASTRLSQDVAAPRPREAQEELTQHKQRPEMPGRPSRGATAATDLEEEAVEGISEVVEVTTAVVAAGRAIPTLPL